MKVDIRRLADYIPELFAPQIIDGQEFFAYIDGNSNSFTIQAENILHASVSNLDSNDVENLAAKLALLQAQADSLETLANSIPAVSTQIQTLSGQTEGLPNFEFASLHEEIAELKTKFSKC